MSDQLTFDQITVHCFWQKCKHVERSHDSQQVHDAMERHYAAKHQADLARLGY